MLAAVTASGDNLTMKAWAVATLLQVFNNGVTDSGTH